MEVLVMLSCVWQDDQPIFQVDIALLFPWETKEPLKVDWISRQSCNLPFCALVENSLLNVVNEGFKEHKAELIDEGLGGTYILFDKDGQKAAVWKPADEESTANLNPKQQQPPRNGFVAGSGYLREVAAYLLDTTGAVPLTMVVNHEGRPGSIQQFVVNDGSAEEYGPGKYPVDQVHNLGLLDLRLLNTDRHGGNVLVKKSNTIDLIPIDHGFCLGGADSLQEILDFEWLHWPQAEQSFSQEIKDKILAIDIEKDVQTLRELGIEEDAILLHRAADYFVRWALKKDWSLKQMGEFVTRPEPDVCSQFENLFIAARNSSDCLGSFERGLTSC
jgi:hypothetical protein